MVKLIVLCVIGILILSFFGITIQGIVQSPAGQANFGYVGGLLAQGWDWLVTFVRAQSAQLQTLVSK